MIDREKVIKGLNYCTRLYIGCKKCPYFGTSTSKASCECQLKTDALELLKEQEAVEPVTESSVYDPDTWFFVCGSCKKSVIDRGDKFCRWCGRSVKWE